MCPRSSPFTLRTLLASNHPLVLDCHRHTPKRAGAGRVSWQRGNLKTVFEVAAEISRRSAKHSAEFLNRTPGSGHIKQFKSPEVTQRGTALAAEFAARAGGIAADAWAALPAALASLNSNDALRLLNNSIGFLERGGGSALQVLLTGGEVLRTLAGNLR